MAMTSGTNKWASRAVVILQLAAWSAVGIVLLQKGVSSLQKESEPRNISQIIPISSPSFHPSEDKDLSVIPIISEHTKVKENPNPQNSILSEKLQGGGINRDVLADKSKVNAPGTLEFNEEIDGPKVLESVDPLAKEELEKQKEILEEINNLKKTVKQKKVDDTYKKDTDELIPSNKSKGFSSIKLVDNKNLLNSSAADQENQRVSEKTDDVSLKSTHVNIFQTEDHLENKTVPASSTSKPSVWETRRRLRLSHLSGGGAAAAVAMVAVGAVMLVLGPAVIVLRALDERRQERRFQKLAARDDLPPTYEQATLMDEAPRYSSLSLNTILGPPPPPSPTPARVHLV
ncbi:uncharacterized protein [Chelonus insularis]|uniref:uncharacterized protein n=1 Tax=Chelonus insularis TaxID=460826 RepID=UPI00158A8781|nr:uncharacterized protein LOC118067729 [Chelonus insularis]XP_034940534.1 uncharacterized protein LOC118067729 [Chelonus insularis]